MQKIGIPALLLCQKWNKVARTICLCFEIIIHVAMPVSLKIKKMNNKRNSIFYETTQKLKTQELNVFILFYITCVKIT